jgi:hypothetical protein
VLGIADREVWLALAGSLAVVLVVEIGIRSNESVQFGLVEAAQVEGTRK